jgi:hypothetical protein
LETTASDPQRTEEKKDEQIKIEKENQKKKKQETDSLNTFKNSKGQDKSKLQKDIDDITRKIKSNDEENQKHGERFIYKKEPKSSSSSLREVSSANQKQNSKAEITNEEIAKLILSFPKEEPALVGTLYNKENKRHLAIQYWEEYEKAKQEAERLNAVLCVTN